MKRSDGTRIRDLDPFVRMVPYIMERRSDATNYGKRTFATEPIDHYIHKVNGEGHKFSYLHVFVAACVRVLAERPQLNRFIINGRYYQRKSIGISMAVKRSFREDGEETTVKFEFQGHETIFEIAETIDRVIAEAIAGSGSTDQDELIGKLLSLPGFLPKLLIKFMKWLDQVNLLPESIIKISPFHTSLFFTYLKSIKTDYIYHHLYDFGTTGIFMALGLAKKIPVVQDDEVVVKNCVEVGVSTDERLCDGLYLARALRLFEKYLADPHLLEERPTLKKPVISV